MAQPVDGARYAEMLKAFRECSTRRDFDRVLLVFFADRTYARLDLQSAATAVLREKGWPDYGGDR